MRGTESELSGSMSFSKNFERSAPGGVFSLVEGIGTPR